MSPSAVVGHPLAAVPVLCAAVLVLGYLGHFVNAMLLGTDGSEEPRSDPDEPTGVGGAASSGQGRLPRPVTLDRSAPTGEELPKRRWY